MILDSIKEEYVKGLLEKGKRGDGRQLLEYRQIKLDKGIIPNAEGSALAHIGATKVLAGIKFDVITPYRDKPDEGTIVVNAEFSPMAHPTFEPGPPRENSIELSRIVDRGIRSAECLDFKKLFLEEEKALGVFIDLYILDHSGNLIDCAALAAMSALLNTRVPKYENKALIRTESSGKLHVQRPTVTCSFEKISGKLLLDATDEEEIASEGRMTLATCSDELICAGQKSGKAGFTKEEMMELVDLTLQKGKELRKHL